MKKKKKKNPGSGQSTNRLIYRNEWKIRIDLSNEMDEDKMKSSECLVGMQRWLVPGNDRRKRHLNDELHHATFCQDEVQ